MINADITGGGTGGRFDKYQAGAVLLTGDNKNLTGSSEVQTRAACPTPVTGFTLTFHGATTAVIDNTTPATDTAVKAALEALPSVGIGNVTVVAQRHGAVSSTRSPTSTTWAASTSGRSPRR